MVQSRVRATPRVSAEPGTVVCCVFSHLINTHGVSLLIERTAQRFTLAPQVPL